MLDFDINTVAVSGVVSVDGAPLPETGGDRGAVVFEREDGGSLIVSLDLYCELRLHNRELRRQN